MTDMFVDYARVYVSVHVFMGTCVCLGACMCLYTEYPRKNAIICNSRLGFQLDLRQ